MTLAKRYTSNAHCVSNLGYHILKHLSHQPAQMQNIDIPPERPAEPQEYLFPYHI